ncbi:MAG: hypothetical protein ACRD6X_22360 [Pyrinomonadaceae bacterium]
MRRNYIKDISSAIIVSLAVAATTVCQTPTPTPSPGPPAMPQVVNFDKATITSIDPKTLPPPFETKSAVRLSRQVAQPSDAKLFVPKGFKINVFAEGGFREPR